MSGMSLQSPIFENSLEIVDVVKLIPLAFVHVIFRVWTEDAFGEGDEICSLVSRMRLHLSFRFSYRRD